MSHDISTREELSDALRTAWFVQCGVERNDPKTITGMTNADPGVVTAVAHGYSDGDQVEIRDVIGSTSGVLALMTDLNRTAYLVANKAADTFELTDLDGVDVDTTAFPTYSSGGEVRVMTAALSGLTHLEGETIQVLVDGTIHDDLVVSSGAVTLDRKAARALGGLGYTSLLETEAFAPQGNLGSLAGQAVRVIAAVVRFLHTLGARVGTGPSPTQFFDPVFREGDHPMDESPPLFTGDKQGPIPGSHGTEPTIYVEQNQPLPMTVLGIFPRLEADEG